MRTLLYISLIIFSFSCNSGQKGNDVGESDGEVIYQENCMLCHGEKGDEGRSGASDLSKSLMDNEQMKEVIVHGRKSMPPFDYLSDEEVKLVIKYIEERIIK